MNSVTSQLRSDNWLYLFLTQVIWTERPITRVVTNVIVYVLLINFLIYEQYFCEKFIPVFIYCSD